MGAVRTKERRMEREERVKEERAEEVERREKVKRVRSSCASLRVATVFGWREREEKDRGQQRWEEKRGGTLAWMGSEEGEGRGERGGEVVEEGERRWETEEEDVDGWMESGRCGWSETRAAGVFSSSFRSRRLRATSPLPWGGSSAME